MEFTTGQLIAGRFMWWFPWRITSPWRPAVFRGSDEWCNPSVAVVVPPFGCLIAFYGRRLRIEADGPCAECRREQERDRWPS